MAHTRANNAEEAVGILGRQLPVYRAAHFIPSEQATAYLGEAYWRAGDYEEGRAVLEELLLIVEPLGMRLVAAHAHRILGEIAAKTDPARAASYFDRSIASLLQIKAEPELARAYAGYGRFHERQGRIAAARDYLTRGLEIFERLGILGEPEKVRRELAELPTE
jgi:tetratricopeptide (TPR) repeat protein